MCLLEKSNRMNKRGQIIEAGLVLIILGMAVIGTGGILLEKNNVYVGDSQEFKVYKYSECKDYINTLPQERVIVFNSKDNLPINYRLSMCPNEE